MSRRESHDASEFYARFAPPEVSADDTINRQDDVDWIHHGDARDMGDLLKPASVALVVTSPPYFAGKEYEEALGQGHIPSDYLDYLGMLRDVFAACVDKLEPGGRIAVNVANLGRKPYRSLAADVIGILQDDLGLLLRGEIIWRKAEGSSGNCAWGSFQSASNPVLRDLTERVIVASKGRFDRARSRHQRAREGLPHQDTIYRDDFMSWTTDVWDIATESATRVGHPAPFPVELPQRLIELYTYRGDLVLDPFMGSGSTAVAAIRTDRHFAGFDTDVTYVESARRRVAEARAHCKRVATREAAWKIVAAPAQAIGEQPDDIRRQAISEGRAAKHLARDLLEQSGFRNIAENRKVTAGVEVSLAAQDQAGGTWYFDVSGAFSKGNDRPGLKRPDTLWKALGKAAVLRHRDVDGRLVLLTTELPEPSSPSGAALKTALSAPEGVPGDPLVFDAIELLCPEAIDRLRRYATEGAVELEPLWPPRPRARGGKQSGHGHRQDQAD